MDAANTNPAMSARAERQAIIALFAVFALLLQVFMPATALAGADARGGAVICTEHGAATPAAPDSPAGHHQGSGCDHCVCPTATALPPTAAAPSGEAVAYAQPIEHAGLGGESCAPGRGLAAPPPPSRGTPQLTV